MEWIVLFSASLLLYYYLGREQATSSLIMIVGEHGLQVSGGLMSLLESLMMVPNFVVAYIVRRQGYETPRLFIDANVLCAIRIHVTKGVCL